MYVENLPWKLIIYKKIKMTIMFKLWWRFWTERWNISVWNVCFDHHDLIRTIRMAHKMTSMPGTNSQCQIWDNHYWTEGVLKENNYLISKYHDHRFCPVESVYGSISTYICLYNYYQGHYSLNSQCQKCHNLCWTEGVEFILNNIKLSLYWLVIQWW